MECDGDDYNLESFLAAHKPVCVSAIFAPGKMFADWRVTAFLGHGGSGEVYRVVHSALGTIAALKVCVKRNQDGDVVHDAVACARFSREVKLLAENKHPAFPRFLGFGESGGWLWYAMELLEYRPLPSNEREIVRFLRVIISGIQHLHSMGFVHRDVKPSNILWRGTSPVLIDLGLVKDMSVVHGHAGESLSIVDGHVVGVGTPRYAAPEQLLSGDNISPQTDVYALGMLVNDCFCGNPPRAWRRIIQRATSAIPAHRYATAASFLRAIILLRVLRWIRGAAVFLFAAAIIGFLILPRKGGVTSAPVGASTADSAVAGLIPESEKEKTLWKSLCRNIATNIVARHFEVRYPASGQRRCPEGFPPALTPPPVPVVTSRVETNKIIAVMVELGGGTNVFTEPISLDYKREYWIVGPGIFDAQFSGSSTATVHVANCVFLNRTNISPGKSGINYVLDGGAYLNFTGLPPTSAMYDDAKKRIRENDMVNGRRLWRIKGPETLLGLEAELNSTVYSATMKSFYD